MPKHSVLIDHIARATLFKTSKRVTGLVFSFFLREAITLAAPTEPTEGVDKVLIYAVVLGFLAVIMASGVAYLIIKRKRRKLA